MTKIITFSKPKKTIIALLIAITFVLIIIPTVTTKSVYSEGNNAPNFNLKTIGGGDNGKQISLESFKGKPVILWFMATWCPSCVGQAAAIKQITEEYGNKVNVVVIDLWSAQNIGQQQQQQQQGAQGFNAETESDLQSFVAKYGSPQWNATFDTDGVSIKYGIMEVDSTVVVDGNGNVVLTHLGPSGYQPIKDALAKTII